MKTFLQKCLKCKSATFCISLAHDLQKYIEIVQMIKQSYIIVKI